MSENNFKMFTDQYDNIFNGILKPKLMVVVDNTEIFEKYDKRVLEMDLTTPRQTHEICINDLIMINLTLNRIIQTEIIEMRSMRMASYMCKLKDTAFVLIDEADTISVMVKDELKNRTFSLMYAKVKGMQALQVNNLATVVKMSYKKLITRLITDITYKRYTETTIKIFDEKFFNDRNFEKEQIKAYLITFSKNRKLSFAKENFTGKLLYMYKNKEKIIWLKEDNIDKYFRIQMDTNKSEELHKKMMRLMNVIKEQSIKVVACVVAAVISIATFEIEICLAVIATVVVWYIWKIATIYEEVKIIEINARNKRHYYY